VLLQQALKTTYEAPPGLKRNLQRTFEGWEPEQLPAAAPVHCRLLLLLACFHAVVQERRAYVPQGWTRFYECSDGDLRGLLRHAGALLLTAPSLLPPPPEARLSSSIARCRERLRLPSSRVGAWTGRRCTG
jgi:hypothetical protein